MSVARGSATTRSGFSFTPSPTISATSCAPWPWSLTTLREKLVKIGTKVVSHGRYVTFPMAEVAVSRRMFRQHHEIGVSAVPSGKRSAQLSEIGLNVSAESPNGNTMTIWLY